MTAETPSLMSVCAAMIPADRGAFAPALGILFTSETFSPLTSTMTKYGARPNVGENGALMPGPIADTATFMVLISNGGFIRLTLLIPALFLCMGFISLRRFL